MARPAAARSPSEQTSFDDLLAPATRTAGAAGDARALCTELLRWEGFRREMFVDGRGDVRTGVGHRLPSAGAAMMLPWRHRATRSPATRVEVRVAFEQARAQAAGRCAPAHQRASDLVLPPGFAIALALRRIERELLPGLRSMFPGFDKHPLPARRALVDMAYDLGLAGLRNFYNLIAACRRFDFAAAAEHCHRRAGRPARNATTKALFLEAARPTR